MVHAAVPGLGEDIKWRMPHFTLNGKNLAGMAAFKAHCAFVIHGDGRQGMARDGEMGAYGKITSVDDLPPAKELQAKLIAAASVIAGGEKKARPAPKPRAEIPMPDDLAQALSADPAAQAVFEGSRPPTGATIWNGSRGEAARHARRRIAQTVEWVVQGKRRNWKYENC
jgi:uncharacterized protein YdeI (YjbR/CyaY-like superfamily)